MVSIITATYNHARFLAGALESVIRQSYLDWEHVIINDGSTDDTQEVLERHRNSRCRILKTPNRGQAEALNLGLAEAKGDLIAFLDSDDEFLPDHLELMVSLIGDRRFLLGKFALENFSGNPKALVRDFYHPGKEIEVEKIEVITGVLFGMRSAFLEIGGFRNVLSTDTDMFNRLKSAGFRWGRLEKPTYRYFFGRSPESMAIRDLKKDRL